MKTITQKIKKMIATGNSNAEIKKALPKATAQQIYSQRHWIKKNADADKFVAKVLEETNIDAHSSGHQFDMPKSILDDAREIIYGDREKTYGSPDKNLQAIAEYWSNHLHTRFGAHLNIKPEDVCIMMTLLKAARLGNDITHRDSLVDAVGYLALLERIQK